MYCPIAYKEKFWFSVKDTTHIPSCKHFKWQRRGERRINEQGQREWEDIQPKWQLMQIFEREQSFKESNESLSSVGETENPEGLGARDLEEAIWFFPQKFGKAQDLKQQVQQKMRCEATGSMARTLHAKSLGP